MAENWDREYNKPVGKLIYHHNPDEVVVFHNPARMLDELQENLYNYGIMGWTYEIYWQNLDFQYEIHRAVVEEVGGFITRSDFIIDNTDPAFKLRRKLSVINAYEAKHVPAEYHITEQMSEEDITIADRIDCSMSVRGIKKLIDKWYGIALKSQEQHKIDIMDIPPPDYPPVSIELPQKSIKDRVAEAMARISGNTLTKSKSEKIER